jgi:hypothetical protein
VHLPDASHSARTPRSTVVVWTTIFGRRMRRGLRRRWRAFGD